MTTTQKAFFLVVFALVLLLALLVFIIWPFGNPPVFR